MWQVINQKTGIVVATRPVKSAAVIVADQRTNSTRVLHAVREVKA